MFGAMFGRKRIADWKRSCAELQRQHDALAKQHDALAGFHKALVLETAALKAAVEGIQEQARLAARTKVKTRDPKTGRFVWRYADEVEGTE